MNNHPHQKLLLPKVLIHLFLGILIFFICTEFALANPEPFWWGISTSSYQTEDQNSGFKTDWDIFYENGHLKEPRAQGTYSYSQFDRDLEQLLKLGVSHYRFGIEWARIEPKPGQFDEEALNHYFEMVLKLKKNNITPIICLWHFTFPDWLYNEAQPEVSGWLHPEFANRWNTYVTKVLNKFGKEVQYYAPENEPNAYALAAFFLGAFPPGLHFKLELYRKNMSASAVAFKSASQIIHELSPGSKVITIQNMVLWKKAWWDFFGYFNDLGEEYNFSHLNQVHESADWMGFNYYFERTASPFPSDVKVAPQGLKFFIDQFASRYHKPILITENGVSDSGDQKRLDYLKSHLAALEESLKAGYDVRGYFFWSLIDNFEWSEGYKEKFGIYSLSPDHLSLIPKPSALYYESVIKKKTP
jgi:beta-glucosidase